MIGCTDHHGIESLTYGFPIIQIAFREVKAGTDLIHQTRVIVAWYDLVSQLVNNPRMTLSDGPDADDQEFIKVNHLLPIPSSGP